MILIDTPSASALLIRARHDNSELGTGTGFIVDSANGPLLITNWHIVTGRHLETRKPCRADAAIPNNLLVRHNRKTRLGAFCDRVEPLYDEGGNPVWFEHPHYRATVDVVALPLTQLDDVETYPLSYSGEVGDELPEPIRWGASDIVFVVGFPFGWTGSGDFAIWAQGAVATEPGFDFRKLPCFLIDSRTRMGQSGSPVLIYRRGGNFVQLAGGEPYMLHNPRTKLLGVYSGRLSEDSDLGTVWKVSLIATIAERGI